MPRTRAWRRAQARKDARRTPVKIVRYKPEKNWKLLYTRSDKLFRARQLGLGYPIRTIRQLLDQT